MRQMSAFILVAWAAVIMAQEQRQADLLDLYAELSRCGTFTYEDTQSTNTQAVYVDKANQVLNIIMVVEWPDGEKWTTETRVALRDIDAQSLSMVMPNTGIAATVEEVLQYGGIEITTDQPVVRVIEKRNGVTAESETWSAFIRVDDDDKRRCVFVALLAIVSQVQGITP